MLLRAIGGLDVGTHLFSYETASSVEDDVDWVKVEKPEEKDGNKNSFLSFPSYFYEKEIQLTSNSLSSHQQQLLLPESPGRK